MTENLKQALSVEVNSHMEEQTAPDTKNQTWKHLISLTMYTTAPSMENFMF